jgi:predicted DNA-binding transcriptional regulator YafY
LIDKEVVDFFKTKEYFPYQKVLKTDEKGNLILETTIGKYEEIRDTIFSWIPTIKVIKPVKFRKYLMERINEYIKGNDLC